MRNERQYIDSVNILDKIRNFRLNESEDKNSGKEAEILASLKEIDNPSDDFVEKVIAILGIKTSKPEEKPKNDNKDSVSYTQQDDMLGTSLQTCKTQFGADFSKSKAPMLYYPKDGDVVLSGKISRLGDAEFQFRLKDPSGYGCFVWNTPLQLSDENLNTLKVIYGVYKNWKDDLHKSDDNRPLSIKNHSNGSSEAGDDAEM